MTGFLSSLRVCRCCGQCLGWSGGWIHFLKGQGGAVVMEMALATCWTVLSHAALNPELPTAKPKSLIPSYWQETFLWPSLMTMQVSRRKLVKHPTHLHPVEIRLIPCLSADRAGQRVTVAVEGRGSLLLTGLCFSFVLSQPVWVSAASWVKGKTVSPWLDITSEIGGSAWLLCQVAIWLISLPPGLSYKNTSG
jgi:hypothetical protein